MTARRPSRRPKPKPPEPDRKTLLGVPDTPDWLTDRGHPDACGTCHHPHVNGRSGTCSVFVCPCATWTPPPKETP